jgi:8-oxo-dGTP pyrophosphatase MutT (NUDIX family)
MTKIGIKTRVSAIIFDSKGLVLTKHFVNGFGEYFLLPGGGLDKGESPIEALNRECKEEIGVDIQTERLVYYKSAYSDEDTYLDLIFLCKSLPISAEFLGKVKYPEE